MTITSAKVGLVLVASTFLQGGCSTPAKETAPVTPVTEQAAARPTPPVSVNALMVAFIDHAGHALWDAETKAPKTDAEWAVVEHHATQLAAAGSLLALGGTGVHDRTHAEQPGWQKWSRALSDAGLAAVKATHGRDLEALRAANTQLVETCESCHKEFKPDLPSEGILHAHVH